MNKDTPKFLVNLTDDAGWLNAIEASADKLIIIDCHQDWCGPCDAIHPMLNKVHLDFDDCPSRLMVCTAAIQIFSEKIQAVVSNDSKIVVEKNGCMPLFLFFRHKACIATVSGVDSPSILSYISNNIPDKKKKLDDD